MAVAFQAISERAIPLQRTGAGHFAVRLAAFDKVASGSDHFTAIAEEDRVRDQFPEELRDDVFYDPGP
eukprot:3371810-Lingulodinium_polyedra.AAC.1